jgi:hypothetical protein
VLLMQAKEQEDAMCFSLCAKSHRVCLESSLGLLEYGLI